MADHVSIEKRSMIMRAVRSTETTPEIAVRKAAHGIGLRFRLYGKGLPGRPDLVFGKWRKVVFVNGCFWHRHARCRKATTPKSNRAFWRKKFAGNVKRDQANYAALSALGWNVVVLWQCEVSRDKQLQRLLRQHFPSPR